MEWTVGSNKNFMLTGQKLNLYAKAGQNWLILAKMSLQSPKNLSSIRARISFLFIISRNICSISRYVYQIDR
ncbi:MAG: hypothetical protein C0200_00245 [Thermoproteota archaeon]|nr:MAG: hypothetical protein C0200_00245 [Candidatus Korarchaeota archaeon]